MDILGFCLLANAFGFLIHAGYNNWGRERKVKQEEDE